VPKAQGAEGRAAPTPEKKKGGKRAITRRHHLRRYGGREGALKEGQIIRVVAAHLARQRERASKKCHKPSMSSINQKDLYVWRKKKYER